MDRAQAMTTPDLRQRGVGGSGEKHSIDAPTVGIVLAERRPIAVRGGCLGQPPQFPADRRAPVAQRAAVARAPRAPAVPGQQPAQQLVIVVPVTVEGFEIRVEAVVHGASAGPEPVYGPPRSGPRRTLRMGGTYAVDRGSKCRRR